MKIETLKAELKISHDLCLKEVAENKRLREALERIYSLTHAFNEQNNYAKVLSDIAHGALVGKEEV